MSLEEVRARVAASYDRLDMPSWPDPHPDRTPADDEYSRVSEPHRFRIVHARARAWAECLGDLPGVQVEPLPSGPLDDDGHFGRFDRGVQVTSSRPGSMPLLLLERDAALMDAVGSLAVLHISVGEPQAAVQMQPDCGCDACDSGSDDLLQAIDETVGHVVGGPFVALRGPGWSAHWHPGGGESGGDGRGPDHAEVMELCRRLAAGEDVALPPGTRAFVGRGWLD